jgi:hypothetical protein
MPPIAFLALLTVALLALAALRLELEFRRTLKAGSAPEPRTPAPESRPPAREPRAPELRAAPAGGYWQAPFPRSPQPPRAGFAL